MESASVAAANAISLANQGAVYPCSLCLDGKQAQLLGATSATAWYMYVRCCCQECAGKPALLDEDDDALDSCTRTCVMTLVQFLAHCRPGLVDAPEDTDFEVDLEDMAFKYMRLVPDPALQAPHQPQGMYLGDALAWLGNEMDGQAWVGRNAHVLNVLKAGAGPYNSSHYALSGKVMSYNAAKGCLQIEDGGQMDGSVDVHLALMPILEASILPPTHLPPNHTWPILQAPAGYMLDRDLDAALSMFPNSCRTGFSPTDVVRSAVASPAAAAAKPIQDLNSPTYTHDYMPVQPTHVPAVQAGMQTSAQPQAGWPQAPPAGVGAGPGVQPAGLPRLQPEQIVILDEDEEQGAEHSPRLMDDTATSAAAVGAQAADHSMQPGVLPPQHAGAMGGPTNSNMGGPYTHTAPGSCISGGQPLGVSAAQPLGSAPGYQAPQVGHAPYTAPHPSAIPVPPPYGAPQPTPPPAWAPTHTALAAFPAPSSYTQQPFQHASEGLQGLSIGPDGLPPSESLTLVSMQQTPWRSTLEGEGAPRLHSPDDIEQPTLMRRKQLVMDGFFLLLNHSGMDEGIRPTLQWCFGLLPWAARLELYMQLYQRLKGCRLDMLDVAKMQDVDDWIHELVHKAKTLSGGLMTLGASEHIDFMMAQESDSLPELD